ncbi:MAG: 4-(cytidine 5'-diphospho)-2-C-methyl-D-erythritol kinase [Chitinispirillaceae bacterium]|nr:4-(cytidine 5'-diphospho)-2-C-methyl-D-erythritol kinase [Chitinispirillaceae bacterium]
MLRNSYTRLTLALDIIGKIHDGPWKGYHELGTIKHQIDLCDTITIEPSDHLSLECNDPQVPCDERNLCLQAVTLLQREYDITHSVRITIDKRIPVKGGLAGGSANAATTLMLLNELWKIHLSRRQLMKLGRVLGMDVPFYFIGHTAFDSEATGVCRALSCGIKLNFVLALPDFGVSTADAYRGIDYAKIGKNTDLTASMEKYCLAKDAQGVVSSIHNDFENSVFTAYPALRTVKEELLDAGCSTAVLSGSGSTLYGIVPGGVNTADIQKKMSCRTIAASTLS